MSHAKELVLKNPLEIVPPQTIPPQDNSIVGISTSRQLLRGLKTAPTRTFLPHDNYTTNKSTSRQLQRGQFRFKITIPLDNSTADSSTSRQLHHEQFHLKTQARKVKRSAHTDVIGDTNCHKYCSSDYYALLQWAHIGNATTKIIINIYRQLWHAQKCTKTKEIYSTV